MRPGAGRGALLAALLLGAAAAAATAQPRQEQPRTWDPAAQERALREIGGEVKEAVLRGDAGRIARYVRGPLACAGGPVAPDTVTRDLGTKGTDLHAYFFDPATYRKRFGAPEARPMALREFLQRASDLRIQASVSEAMTGRVSYRSSVSPVAPFLDFVHEQGLGWRLSGGGLPGCEQ